MDKEKIKIKANIVVVVFLTIATIIYIVKTPVETSNATDTTKNSVENSIDTVVQTTAPTVKEKGETVTLSTGNYVTGEDIKVGKYDLTVKSGNGNLIITGINGTLKVNEVFGIKTDDSYNIYNDSYNNLKLEEGDEIQMTSGLSVLFTAK